MRTEQSVSSRPIRLPIPIPVPAAAAAAAVVVAEVLAPWPKQ